MGLFHLSKLDLNMSRPDFEMRFEDQAGLTQARLKAFIKMKRSVGSDRERITLATQIRQVISTERSQVSGGFLSKMFGGRK